MSGNPTRKNPTNPSPNTAKFVLTTWAACFARQKPVSTSANPACMKITSTAPTTIQRRLRLTPTSVVVATLPASLIDGSSAQAVPAINVTMRSVSTPTAANLRLLRSIILSSRVGLAWRG